MILNLLATLLLTHSVSYDIPVSYSQSTLQVPAFDQALGDLQGIVISGDSDNFIQLRVENLTPDEGFYMDVGDHRPFGLTTTIRLPNNNILMQDAGFHAPIRINIYNGYDGVTDFTGESGITSGNLGSVHPLRTKRVRDFAPFLGKEGQIIDCNVHRSLTWSTSQYPDNFVYAAAFQSGMPTLKITYFYASRN